MCQLSNPLVLALWSIQVDEYSWLLCSNPNERTAIMSNSNTESPVKAPKIPVETHRGLKVGSRIPAGESTVFMVESMPRRDNPAVKEPVYMLVRSPTPEGGVITLKMDIPDCPQGTHGNRKKYGYDATVGMPLGELEVVELWERNGRVQGRLSGRKPAEERILREFNAIDELTGERKRVFVDALVVDTTEVGLRLRILEGVAAGWEVFVHVSNVPGGEETVNKCLSEETVLVVEIIVARETDRSRKNEANRFEGIVLQGSFEQVENKKRADAQLLEDLVGNRKGKLTGTVIGATQTAFKVELNTPSKAVFEIASSQRFFPKIGDEVPLQGIIEGGELKVVPAKGHK